MKYLSFYKEPELKIIFCLNENRIYIYFNVVSKQILKTKIFLFEMKIREIEFEILFVSFPFELLFNFFLTFNCFHALMLN